MKKKFIIISCLIPLILPTPILAATTEGVEMEQKEVEQPSSTQQFSNKDIEREERSGEGLIITGIVLTAAGGAATIAGSTILVAKPDKKLLGAVLSGTGAAVALAGGIIMMFGYQRRSQGGMYYSVAPTVTPGQGPYGLSFAMNF